MILGGGFCAAAGPVVFLRVSVCVLVVVAGAAASPSASAAHSRIGWTRSDQIMQIVSDYADQIMQVTSDNAVQIRYCRSDQIMQIRIYHIISPVDHSYLTI